MSEISYLAGYVDGLDGSASRNATAIAVGLSNLRRRRAVFLIVDRPASVAYLAHLCSVKIARWGDTCVAGDILEVLLWSTRATTGAVELDACCIGHTGEQGGGKKGLGEHHVCRVCHTRSDQLLESTCSMLGFFYMARWKCHMHNDERSGKYLYCKLMERAMGSSHHSLESNQ